MNLNTLAQTVHSANLKWWQDPATGEAIQRNKGELLALIHSEVSEALEGERKTKRVPCPHCGESCLHIGLELESGHIWSCGRCQRQHVGPQPADVCLMDDKLPQYPMAAVEIIDAIIRGLDYLAGFHPSIDVQEVFDAKMAFNSQREDHKHEARLIAGGKQF